MTAARPKLVAVPADATPAEVRALLEKADAVEFVRGPIGADASTIRELIDAGRYPKDAAGRPVVPLRMGAFATITSTTLDGPKCIGGVLGQDDQPTAWRADGRWYTDDGPPGM